MAPFPYFFFLFPLSLTDILIKPEFVFNYSWAGFSFVEPIFPK